MLRITTITPESGTERTVRGPFALLIWLAWALVIALGVVVALVLLVPLALLALVIGLGAWLYARLTRALRREHEPNGVLDGRRNVRVIDPDSPRDGGEA
ncbi:MAG: hypothetical protein IT433_02035 [Phycisphaerales bacterium]|nr:hypothetical protein [Phycisphaerales bacterium]